MAAGDPVNSADLTTLQDYTIRKPICRLLQQSAQSLTNNTTTAITYGSGSEDIDTHNFHDPTTNNTRITPTIEGYYRVMVHTAMNTPSSAYTQITATIRKVGTSVEPQVIMRPDAASIAGSTAQTTATVYMNGTTDYLEHFANQQNGGAAAQNTSATTGFRCVFEVVFERPV